MLAEGTPVTTNADILSLNVIEFQKNKANCLQRTQNSFCHIHTQALVIVLSIEYE